MHYFALTTRGLEDIVADEVRTLCPAAQCTEVAYRRVLFDAPPEAAPTLLGLRCADDLFLLVDTWQGIGRPRTTLNRIADLAGASPLQPALALCAALRPLQQPPSFTVSASFVGKRNYTSLDMKLAVAAGVEQQHNWHYRDDEAPDALSLRLFIEHDLALFGVRLAVQPLHRRPYRATTIPGSLKPPVAAALVRLAQTAPGAIFLDPMCGAGTTMLEAALMGAKARGGDIDPAAITVAKTNFQAAGLELPADLWDARRLPLHEHTIDAIACNLPFGRQVAVDSDLAALYAALLDEFARVLRPAGRAALLTGVPELLPAHPKLPIIAQREISLHGQNPTIVIADCRL